MSPTDPHIVAIREWLQFGFVIVGGTIALVAFLQNQRQRKLENALKLVALFKDSLREHDLDHWHKLLVATCEPAGAQPGYFRSESGDLLPLDTMFSEGSEDDDAIQRIAQNLEIICYEINSRTVEPRIVWFELGQLMSTMHQWLTEIRGLKGKRTFLEEQFPAINRSFKKYGKRFQTWPYRVFGYIE
jgi:hypothetical protein